jgi:hypothetical protein
MPRFAHSELSPRREDNILSFSPQEAALLIAKPQAGICPGTGNGIDGEHAASRLVSSPGADDVAHRFRSVFDVPVNNIGPAFSWRGSQAHAPEHEKWVPVFGKDHAQTIS